MTASPETVARVLRGEVLPRDVRDIVPSDYSDPLLGQVFAIALSYRELFATPTDERIERAFRHLALDTTGLRPLLSWLRSIETRRSA